MIRKDKHKFADGTFKTQIRVMDGYRDKKTNKVKQKTVKSFGYLEDNKDQEAFMKTVKEFDRAFQKQKRVEINSVSTKAFYEDEGSSVYNFGYKYLESIYDSLGLNKVFDEFQYKGTASLNQIFKFLVIERILNPDSKNSTHRLMKNLYNMNTEFSLAQIYRSLTCFSKLNNQIQKQIDTAVKSLVGRNTEEVFYDSTNYYFQKDYEDPDDYVELDEAVTDSKLKKKEGIIDIIDENNVLHQYKKVSGLRKRGVSKEHAVDPIVQFGLLMDSSGIPISMQIFPGNTSDCKTLLPVLSSVKEEFGVNRVIVVADKGMNTSENIDAVCSRGDGYMFSQILRGKKGRRYADRLFDEDRYTVVNEDYKYQLFEEEYGGTDAGGHKVMRKRKVLLYYNGEAARREKKKRAEKIFKAERSLGNNAYSITHGYDRYLKSDHIVKATGEIANKEVVSLNTDKIKKDAEYDGFFAIVTSELQFDEKKIREVYHGLWRIEESFRITKSDLEVRPVFVRTKEHIEGHFIICFAALAILRILQKKMNYSVSVERIVRALHMCSCSEIQKGTVHVLKNEESIDYKTVKDKSGSNPKYQIIRSQNETVEDYLKIMECFEQTPFKSLMNKSEFDKLFNKINFKK